MASLIITGDSSGTLTLKPEANTGTTTVTIPATSGNVIIEDSSGDASIAGNFTASGRCVGSLVGFYAYDSSTILDTGVTTTAVFTSEGYDTHNAYNTTNGRFTAPVSGYYFLHANLRAPVGATNCRFDITFYINGVANGGGGMNQTNSNDLSSMATHVLYLNANDYVEVKGNQNSGSSLTLSSSNNAGGHAVNHFTGYLVGT